MTEWIKNIKSKQGKNFLNLLLNPVFQKWAVILLAFILAIQAASWGWAYFDFKRMDWKVSSITNPEKEEKPESQDDKKTNKPQGPNGMNQSNLNPKDNIFKRSVVPYVLTAILSDKAIIDGQMVGVGDRISSATVDSIGIDKVVLAMEGGATREVQIFSPANMQAFQQPDKMAGLGQEAKPMLSAPPSNGQKMPSVNIVVPQNAPMPSQFNLMPGQFGGKLMERFQNMSEEERAQFIKERMANRPPPGERGGGRGRDRGDGGGRGRDDEGGRDRNRDGGNRDNGDR